MANQLKRVYGANKASPKPFHLHFFGLKADGRILRKCCDKNTGFLDYSLTFDSRPVVDAFKDNAGRVVYLSPDAADEMEGLDPTSIYIIGGLVDDSVQSRVSLDYAREAGLRTARLPIQRYMRRRCSAESRGGKQILTINQVFDILLAFYETADWRLALSRGVPPRTGFVIDEES